MVWGCMQGFPCKVPPPGMLQTPRMLQPPSDAPISWDGPDPWDALIPRDDPSLLGCTNPSGYSEPLGCSNPSGYSDPLGCSRPPGCSALPQDAPAPLTLGQDPAPVGTPLYPAQSWAVPGCDGARGPRQDRIPSPAPPPPQDPTGTGIPHPSARRAGSDPARTQHPRPAMGRAAICSACTPSHLWALAPSAWGCRGAGSDPGLLLWLPQPSLRGNPRAELGSARHRRIGAVVQPAR